MRSSKTPSCDRQARLERRNLRPRAARLQFWLTKSQPIQASVQISAGGGIQPRCGGEATLIARMQRLGISEGRTAASQQANPHNRRADAHAIRNRRTWLIERQPTRRSRGLTVCKRCRLVNCAQPRLDGACSARFDTRDPAFPAGARPFPAPFERGGVVDCLRISRVRAICEFCDRRGLRQFCDSQACSSHKRSKILRGFLSGRSAAW